MPKILIINTDVGIQIVDGRPTNATAEELCGIYLALEKQGYEPWIAVNPGIDGRPKFRTVERQLVENINDFDELLINREVPNFFGGEYNQYNIWTLNALIRFKGRINLFYCDPEMAKGDYLRFARRKIYGGIFDIKLNGKSLTDEERNEVVNKDLLEAAIDRTDKKNLHIRTAYPRIDHKIHDRFKGSEISFIDSWREHLFNIREPYNSIRLVDIPFEDLKKSAAYIGTNKPQRHKRLEELGLFNTEAEDRGEVFFYGNIATFKNVKAKNRLDLSIVNDVYENHVASLVIGNRWQDDTGINHRYLQGLTISRSVLVDSVCDPDKRYLFDKDLANLVYFKDREEYLDRLAYIQDEKRFNDIVSKLQKEKELTKVETAEEFQKRVSS